MPTTKRSRSEVGHIKNLENYYDFIQYCRSIEPVYDPVNEQIMTLNMLTQHQRGIQANEDIRLRRYELAIVVNHRQATFRKLKKTSTRMLNALIAITNDQRIIDDYRTINRKVQGRLSIPKTNDNQTNQEIQRAVSNSQQSIDQLIDNFADAIQILELVTVYSPNEPDLKIPALKVYLEELKAANIDVNNKFIPYAKTLDLRDEVFYHPEAGIVNTVKTAKAYIKSVYGYQSPEYTYVSKIHFRSIKRRK